MTLLLTPDWKSVIQAAEQRSTIILPPDLESYLTHLVRRFATEPEVTHRLMAAAWLEAAQSRDDQRLAAVGDECLLIAGLFPEKVARRSLNLSYFVQMGQSAYASVSRKTHDLYNSLATQFVVLMDVLFYVRDSSILLPYEAYQRWHALGSEHAKAVLVSYDKIRPFRK